MPCKLLLKMGLKVCQSKHCNIRISSYNFHCNLLSVSFEQAALYKKMSSVSDTDSGQLHVVKLLAHFQ